MGQLRRTAKWGLLWTALLAAGACQGDVAPGPSAQLDEQAALDTEVLPRGDGGEHLSPALRQALIAAQMQEAGPAFDFAQIDQQSSRFAAIHPSRNMRFELSAQSVRLSPRDQQWHVDLTLVGVGSEGQLEPVLDAEPVSEGNRVEYRRGELTEWYLHGPAGIEQGFTIAARSENRQAGPLVLELEVGSSLQPHLADDGDAIELLSTDGEPRARYSNLYAIDAWDRPVAASMTVEDQRIRLIVEDEDAVYPLRIDPLIVVSEQELTPSDAADNDSFGFAVDIDGDRAVIGAIGNDDSGSSSGCAYVFLRDPNGNWVLEGKLTASDGGAGDRFGTSVSIDGDLVLVGADGDDDNGGGAGAAYVFVRDAGGAWTQEAKLTATDGFGGDAFGRAVSLSGDLALIGAYGADDTVTSSGSAYVFLRTSGTWAQETKLNAPDPATSKWFGRAVSIDGSGTLFGAVIGAHGASEGGVSSGAAYVFFRYLGVWYPEIKLSPADGAAGDYFGRSVSLDGNRVIIGAYGHDANGTDSGAAYVYRHRDWQDWLLEAKLTASDPSTHDRFGESVSLSGAHAIVGAPYDDVGAGNSGSAYVFQYIVGSLYGSTWTQQAKLNASDAAGDDRFGSAVALDGDHAHVGALRNDEAGSNAGASYSFAFSSDVWTEEDKLTAFFGDTADLFGVSVAVDGDTALVGVAGDDVGGTAAGSVYVFTRTASGPWTLEAILRASDPMPYDNFGFSVALDGDRALISAKGADENGSSSGSVYVFERTGGAWTQQAKLLASDGAAYDTFGWSVSLDGDRALIGAPLHDDPAYASGAAYVFVHTGGGAWTEERKLTASVPVAGAQLGRSVSLSGDLALVGAIRDDNTIQDSGSAYVFRRFWGAWIQEAKLVAPDGQVWDQFGFSVSLDGDLALVCAPQAGSTVESGQVYVFERIGAGAWTHEATLAEPEDPGTAPFCGAVSVDGDLALVGPWTHGPGAGPTHVYARSAAGTWAHELELEAPAGSADFGASVALGGDVAFVGAPDVNVTTVFEL